MVDKALTEKSGYAPIIIFCYHRPDHLRRTLESLIRCDGFYLSPVIVYCDGPKDTEQVDAVGRTREIARLMLGDRAEYHFRESNAGLARSVIEGVNDVVGRFGRAIVIEDDLLLSPQFLRFMNLALDRYADDESVFQVSGYMFGEPKLASQSMALFLPFIGSWGWATWQRAWNSFDPNAIGWLSLRSDSQTRLRFNLDDSYDYATMLFNQMTGQGQSWAIRWYWTLFKISGLVLYPPVSMVKNIGLDGSGTHGSGRLRRITENYPGLHNELEIEFPDRVEIHQPSFVAVKNELRWRNGRWLARVVDRFRWWKAVIASYRFKS